MDKLNLRKDIILDIKKRKGIKNVKATVVVALDYSGSMERLYQNGTVQETIERLFPIALAFDDNGELDFYLFHDGSRKTKNVTLANYASFVRDEIKGQMGGTNYAPVIEEILHHNGIPTQTKPESKGFFSSMFSKKETVIVKPEPLEFPIYVIFITDGQNGDRQEAEDIIRHASHYGIFFQFVGIGGARFDFLRNLDNLSGRLIDNANFFEIMDINTMSDETLYDRLMFEFPQWMPLAKTNNLIK